ncbi:LysM peptidoglycan-binding domain-containing protein [Nonomuraea sp. NPDC059007]|uniref:LysM peptidoglycan-binding domain-containing protein n=1 Tax=Nonomuraea sp. NPDC059007 TaxID=3346692 RepID=UPI0036C2BB16
MNTFDPAPLVDLVTNLAYAARNMGSDADERRLQEAAQAHRQLSRDLALLAEDPVHAAIAGWRGQAATAFRERWGKVSDPKVIAEIIRTNEEVARILEASAQASHQTKKALYELLRTILEAIAIGYALSFVSAGVSAALAYGRAIRAAGQAVGLLKWFQLTARALGLALRRLPRLSGTGPLGAFDAAFTSRFATTLAGYKNVYKIGFKAIIGTQMAAQGLSGNSVFNLSPMTFTQASRIATAAATFGSLGKVILSGGRAMAGRKGWEFGAGLLQGASGSTWAASLVKSGGDIGVSAAAFGAFVSSRNGMIALNPALAVLKNPLTAGFRVIMPLSTPADVGNVPRFEAPEPGEVRKVGFVPFEGGSLADIAAKVYGDAARWPEIYEANKDTLGSGTTPKPGTLLRVPLDP